MNHSSEALGLAKIIGADYRRFPDITGIDSMPSRRDMDRKERIESSPDEDDEAVTLPPPPTPDEIKRFRALGHATKPF